MTVYGADLSNHNGSVNWDALDALADVHLVTHKITEGIGWTDPDVAARAPQLKRFAAAGFYHVLWPTNSADNPQNQAQWFVGEIVRLAPWMLTHPCPVAQGDFELFGNFTPYRAPTIAECNSFNKWVLYYWHQHTANKLYQPNYAPHWLYGDTLTGLAGDLWASSYVGGSGGYRALYPGDSDRRWVQIPSKPATILQYTSTGNFGTAASGVDANAVRGVSTAAELQALFLGGDTPVTPADVAAIVDGIHDMLLRGSVLTDLNTLRDRTIVPGFAAVQAQQAKLLAGQVTDAEFSDALAKLVPTLTSAVAAAVTGGATDPDAIARSVVLQLAELLKGVTTQ